MKSLNSKKIILVVGAGGFIGKNLSEYLISKDYQVRMLVRKNSFRNFFIPSNADYFMGDITDLDSMIKASKNVYAVVNCAAKKADEEDSFKVNVNGGENILKACKINGVKKIIQLSSVSAKILKKGTYGQTKALADEIIQQSRISYVILRISLVYGDGLEGVFGSLIKATKYPIVPVFGDGKWISYPIYIKDLSLAIEKAVLNDDLLNKVWDVGGERAIDFDSLIKRIALIQGKTVTIVHIPVNLGLTAVKFIKLFWKKFPFTVSNILGSTQNTDIDIENYLKNFKIQPKPLNEGLKENIIFKYNQQFNESVVLSKYILSSAGIFFEPDKAFVINYINALKIKEISGKDVATNLAIKFPALIGAIDIYLRRFFPEAKLLKKLTIITALLECQPQIAGFFLPKETTRLKILLKSFIIGISLSLKISLALIISPVLFLYFRNEK